MSVDTKHAAWFVAGALFGSVGVKLLSSKDAIKAYTHAVAAGLRMKDCTMETVTNVQEKFGDIVADAKEINEERAAAAEAAAEIVEPEEEVETVEEA